MAKLDAVQAARKTLSDAETAAAAAAKRAEDAEARAEAYASQEGEAGADDERTLAKDAKVLAELRATADLLAGRARAAASRVEPAREALTTATATANAARLAELRVEIARAEADAQETLRQLVVQLRILVDAQAARTAEAGRLGSTSGATKLGSRLAEYAGRDDRGLLSAVAMLLE